MPPQADKKFVGLHQTARNVNLPWIISDLWNANSDAISYFFYFSLRTQGFIFTTGFLYYLITAHVCFFCFFAYPATISYWKGEGLVNLLPGHHESQLLNVIPKEDKEFFFLLFKKFTRKIHQNEFESWCKTDYASVKMVMGKFMYGL